MLMSSHRSCTLPHAGNLSTLNEDQAMLDDGLNADADHAMPSTLAAGGTKRSGRRSSAASGAGEESDAMFTPTRRSTRLSGRKSVN